MEAKINWTFGRTHVFLVTQPMGRLWQNRTCAMARFIGASGCTPPVAWWFVWGFNGDLTIIYGELEPSNYQKKTAKTQDLENCSLAFGTFVDAITASSIRVMNLPKVAIFQAHVVGIHLTGFLNFPIIACRGWNITFWWFFQWRSTYRRGWLQRTPCQPWRRHPA